ncbi:MAG: tetratricopeptide repeat protein [Chloroflexia bacterium]
MAETWSVSELLERAQQAVRGKRREEARQLLLQAIEIDEWNEQAWLWLSAVVDDPRDMQVALANVLTINPNNEQARKGLELLRKRHGNLLSPEEEPPVLGAAASAELAREAREEAGHAFLCYRCRSEVYDIADYCWNCHAVIHCCQNCIHLRETACKERIGLRGPAASVIRNDCPDWTPPR